MSNKTILQEKNTRLTNYNLDLNAILQTVNNLPNVGSGSEDLAIELDGYDSALDTQETTIDDILAVLATKGAGDSEEWILTYEDGTVENIRVVVS